MTVLIDHLTMHANCDTIAMCNDGRQFLVGTYELQEGAQQIRLGSISLFTSDGKKFQLMRTCEAAAGVLDIKFRKGQTVMRRDGSELFVAALADGTIRLGTVTPDNRVTLEDDPTMTSQPESKKHLALSVSWSPANCADSEPSIAGTFSSGTLYSYKLSNHSSSLVLLGEYTISEMELWAVLHHGSHIYTGGDDSKLWQTPLADGGPSRVMRRFESGVTCIEADPWNEHHLLVGTYEDKMYEFDLRMMRNPKQEVHIGGGVWRIKDHPTQQRLLAIAGMYAGAFIVDCRSDSWSISENFTGHESMCYGIDWWDSKTLLSCSFYDKKLAMWSIGDQQE